MNYTIRTKHPSSYVVRLIFTLIVFASSSTSEKAPYATFAKDATKAPEVASYDYIIVGGGTSGCALAASLSQGANVLVLERGDLPYGIPSMTIDGFFVNLANLSATSPSQTFVSTDGVVNHRGRVLGGGSAINGGFFTKAEPEFINKAGLDPKLVTESYEWAAKKVAFEPKVLAWQAAVRDGLLEAGVLPDNGFTLEHLSGTKVGGSIFDQNGRRHTAADLLEYADPNNIAVYLKATVHRILLQTDEVKAIGVLFKDMNGKEHTALLNEGSLLNEVIITAGTLGSPQLLMLSGIGPSEHLTAHGIEVVLDQPMVGQGMSDNPMNLVLVPTTQPIEISLLQTVGITRFGSYVEFNSFPINLPLLTKYGSQFGYFLNKTTNIDEIISMIGRRWNLSRINVGVIGEKVTGPLSIGVLELETVNPEDNPKVTFNYFQDPQDLKTCVQGMQTIFSVLESTALSNFRDPFLSVQELLALVVALPLNLRHRHINAPFDLEQYCKDTVMTIWHYHGGCQLDRVVDRNYKVIGVGALRVIDSSTFLSSPGTNPQATVMMLGRYMGVKMLGERMEFGKDIGRTVLGPVTYVNGKMFSTKHLIDI